MILGSRTSTGLSIFQSLVQHQRLHTPDLDVFTACIILLVTPSMGGIDKVPLLNPVADSIGNCHNDLFTGAEPRICWQIPFSV
jgi:hypothetical protein